MGAELRNDRGTPPRLARVSTDVQRAVDAGEVRLSESSPSATRFRRAGRGSVEVITCKPLSKNPGALHSVSQRRTSRRISPEPPPSFNSGRDIPTTNAASPLEDRRRDTRQDAPVRTPRATGTWTVTELILEITDLGIRTGHRRCLHLLELLAQACLGSRVTILLPPA